MKTANENADKDTESSIFASLNMKAVKISSETLCKSANEIPQELSTKESEKRKDFIVLNGLCKHLSHATPHHP